MTVVVAHQASEVSERVLAEAAVEVSNRGVELVVLNVTGELDADKEEAIQTGIGDVVEKVGAGRNLSWRVHVVPIGTDVSHTILTAATDLQAELLVIGARKRSPVGKALMGSIAQDLILDSAIPVLVVKR